MSFLKNLALSSVSSSAPGKIILFGEHAVCQPYSKMGVATSVSDMRTRITSSFLENDVPGCNLIIKSSVPEDVEFEFNIEDFVIDESYDIDYSSLNDNLVTKCLEILDSNSSAYSGYNDVERGNLTFVHCGCLYSLGCVASVIGVDILNETNGIRIEMNTDIPIGSGLGSSASLASALTCANLGLFDLLSVDIRTQSLTEHDLEVINLWSYCLESIFHGNPSGLDNLIATNGGTIVLKGGSFTPVDMSKSRDVDLLVVNTKVPRSTSDIVANVRVRYDEDSVSGDEIFDGIEECTLEFLRIVESGGSNNFVEDFSRVIQKNQILLDLFGVVGHPKFDEIFEICRKRGFEGCKITGAGGGGSSYVYCEEGREIEVEELMEELESKGFECLQTSDIGGQGVRIDDFEVR